MRFSLLLCVCSALAIVGAQQQDSMDDVTPRVYLRVYSPFKSAEQQNDMRVEAETGKKFIFECILVEKKPGTTVNLIFRSTSGQTATINKGYDSDAVHRWIVGNGNSANSYRVEITYLTKANDGEYTCSVEYSNSASPVKLNIVLTTYTKVSKTFVSPNMQVSAGSSLTLSCLGSGRPTANSLFTRIGGDSSVIRNYGVRVMRNEITWAAVRVSDAGIYICTIYNTKSRIQFPIELQVTHAPEIQIFPASPSQRVGCSIDLLCSVTANPAATSDSVQWSSSERGTIPAGNAGQGDAATRVRFFGGARHRQFFSLRLSRVRAADFEDTFLCRVANSLGTITKQIRVRKSDKKMPSAFGRVTCGASSHHSRVLNGAAAAATVFLLIMLIA